MALGSVGHHKPSQRVCIHDRSARRQRGKSGSQRTAKQQEAFTMKEGCAPMLAGLLVVSNLRARP
jgi:hypothetical protein